MTDRDTIEMCCIRVIAMVLELHKRGYQHLAIFPGMSPGGLHWRCEILPAGSVIVEDNGAYDIDTPESLEIACYSSGDVDQYFGWEDAKDDNPIQLADKFEDRFRELCSRCRGEYASYSQWLTYVVRMSGKGHLPVMYAEYARYESGYIGSTSGTPLEAPPAVSRSA